MEESQHLEKGVHAVSVVYARTAGISSSHQRDPFRITDATAEGRCFPTTNYAGVRRFRRAASTRVRPPVLSTHTNTQLTHTITLTYPTENRVSIQKPKTISLR